MCDAPATGAGDPDAAPPGTATANAPETLAPHETSTPGESLPPAPYAPAESDRAASPLDEQRWTVEELRRLIARAGAEIDGARRRALEASERDLVCLAMAIASRIVEREVATDPTTLARWIRSGVGALTRDDDTLVAVSPRIAALLGDVSGLPRVEADPALDDDRCEVRTRFGRVDVGARARVETLASELLAEAP